MTAAMPKTVGRWTVLRRAATTSQGGARWFCRCRCGVTRNVLEHNLRSGCSQSCGCSSHETVKARKNYGIWRCPEYKVWAAMCERCRRAAAENYTYYGGRGIRVCRRWLGPNGFANFLSDMGERPKGTQLDRRNNNRNYTPSNCRWATRKEQCRNRRSNRWITYRGQTKLLCEWAELTGLNRATIMRRIHSGWSLDRVFGQSSRQRLEANRG